MIRDLAQPGILMAIAKNRSPAVQAQKQKVISARRDLDGQSTADLNLTPKLSYASPSVSSAIGYGSLNGTLSLGADWKPYVNEEAVNKSAPADNSLTFSIGISGNFSPTSAAQKASLAAAVRLEELKLTAIEQSLDLLIRSRYASYLKAKDSVAEAERAKIVATEISAAARAKAALGQLSPEDIAANEVLVLRSAYTAEKASIALGQAYLALISASNAWDTERFPINGVK
ncbi:hypothetical protein MASR2M78_18260 [Treponema sp.]